MKRREKPEPEPEPIDPARIRELAEQLYAAHQRGESIHATKPGYALCDAAGLWGYEYARSMIAHPAGPRPVDSVAEYIVEHAAEWLAQQERLRQSQRADMERGTRPGPG